MNSKNLLEVNRLPAVLRLARARTKAMIRNRGRKRVIPGLKLFPSISIIIPAHNEEGYIRSTLDSINSQRYPDFETIVVANGCTDATVEMARGHCTTLVTLSTKSLGVSRNLGAKLAHGDILIFLDADTELSPRALRIIGSKFTDADAAATVKGRPDNPYWPFRMIYFLKNFEHRWKLHTGACGVLICWREDFLRIGGFDEALNICEISELIYRLRKFGNYRFISQTTAVTSMRRFAKKGMWLSTWLWLKWWLQSKFGDLRHKTYETIR
jgi:glycosyltransferase involved in cell wall biosynthesis